MSEQDEETRRRIGQGGQEPPNDPSGRGDAPKDAAFSVPLPEPEELGELVGMAGMDACAALDTLEQATVAALGRCLCNATLVRAKEPYLIVPLDAWPEPWDDNA